MSRKRAESSWRSMTDSRSLSFRFRSHRLEHDLQRSAARQSVARRLLLSDAVGRDFGLHRCDRLAFHLVDKIVLDAAAGDRAHDLAVVGE